MSDGVGLSVGATNLAAVVVGRTAVRRSPVVTLYPHRPPEVGVPSENPNLAERGLIITDFVDRVGDPVGIVAADGSTHMADRVLADALGAMLRTVGPPGGPVAVTCPAHWRPAAVDALRTALASGPDLAQAALVSDASAALTALQDDPGLPTRGVVALCDFGGTGTSITLADAANGFAPIGPTLRHTDFSGDLIDQALLTHVLDDLSAAGTIDLSGTSAIGSLSRLRAQCRSAKERLSTAAVTSLVVELPGHHSDVRLTRNELDEAVRGPLAEFVAILRDAVERNGVPGTDLAAVATAGGGARMPIITTTLSEHLRVPVVTTAQPELTAAIGGGLKASRGTVEEGATSMAVAPGVAAAAAAATAMAPEVGAQDAPQSSTFRALAWSDADDAPDVAPSDPYDYDLPAGAGYADGPRPQMQFDYEAWEQQPEPLPWYRKPALVLAAGVLALLAALTAAVLFVMRDDSTPAPASTTGPATTTTPLPATTAAPPPPAAPEPQTQAPRTRTVTEQAPPPPVTVTEAPPPPPTSEAPPPPPPETTEAPPPTTEAPPPTTQQPPWSPPYSTVPGLPWVPAPPTIPGLPGPANP